MPRAFIDYVSPVDVIALTTSFFGGTIELDPASSEEANSLVSAYKFFTPDHNGLKQKWAAKNVYLYPPREFLTKDEQPPNTQLFVKHKKFQKSAQRVWLEQCLSRYRRNEFEEAIVFLTSADVALLTTQKLKLDLPLCIGKDRPKLFVDQPGLPKVNSTRCLSFIYYFPASINTEKRIGEFIEVYSSFGRVFC